MAKRQRLRPAAARDMHRLRHIAVAAVEHHNFAALAVPEARRSQVGLEVHRIPAAKADLDTEADPMGRRR